MKVAFFASDKPRERILADSVLRGARAHGLETLLVPLGEQLEPGSYDVICTFGVKSHAHWHAHKAAGSTMIMFDKGYSRDRRTGASAKWEYWRVAVNDHNPTAFLDRDFPDDRWRKLGIEIAPWRERGSKIIFAGSSAKYHVFYDLPDPTEYATTMIGRLAKSNQRKIIYRPKPSWPDAVPVPHSRFSREGLIEDVLKDAWVLITHGSNACFEAMLHGIPTIVLGNAVTKPISSLSISETKFPRLATDEERYRLASALAYHQWTKPEFASGEAWELLLSEIYAQ